MVRPAATRLRFLLPGLLALALALAAPALHAQAFRAYLSSTGVDAPACPLAAPCRLLPAALAAVADGGEIWILDSANYNTATVQVTKSVTILAVPGAVGSVVATNGAGMFIYTPGIEVTLRNLVFVPLPGTGGTVGLVMGNGAVATIEDCVIANMPQSGMVAGAGNLRVIDSTFRDNGNGGLYLEGGVRAEVTGSAFSGNTGFGIGVLAFNGGDSTRADISDATLDGNTAGLYLLSRGAGSAAASLHGSRIVNNRSNGIMIQSENGGPAVLAATDNIIANNDGGGMYSTTPGSRIFASRNTVTGNVSPGFWNPQGGLFESTNDNAVRHQASNTNGPITVVPMR